MREWGCRAAKSWDGTKPEDVSTELLLLVRMVILGPQSLSQSSTPSPGVSKCECQLKEIGFLGLGLPT